MDDLRGIISSVRLQFISMWNDTDVPRAFLITFRCRGTWVHGDGRGSVDRNNNIFGTTRLPENSNWKRYNESQLKGAPSYLTACQRTIVELAIRETCSVRNWHLHAVNVRTNHVHAVVAAGTGSNSSVIHALKANSTRELRERRNAGRMHIALGPIKAACGCYGTKTA